MTDNIALPNLPSCLAVLIRAKYLRGIHLFCAGFVHMHSLQVDARFFHSPGLLSTSWWSPTTAECGLQLSLTG